MKNTLMATTAIVLVAASASAVDVELYGQVSKGLFSFDDGANTDTVVVDSDMSGTRFGFKGAQALDNGLTASVLFEGEMQSNPSNTFFQAAAVTQAATPASAAPTFDERQARVGLSGAFGGVYLGQQSTASDGAINQDLAGVNDVMGADYRKIGGGLLFRTSGGAALTANSANTMSFSHEVNRADSIRYDSPIYNGFQGRAAIAQGGDMDLGVFYDGGMGDFKVAGALGAYFNNDSTAIANDVVDSEYFGSVSAKHTSGIGATVAYASGSLNRKTGGQDDPSSMYVKVGYAWDAFEVAADMGRQNDWGNTTNLQDSKLGAYGLGAQYNLTKGVTVAALYRNFDADITATNTDSIDLYGVNMKVKF